MKVEIGQKVTFRSDLVAWKKYGVITMLAGPMLKEFNGKTYTVVSVLDNGCFYVNSPHPFILSTEMLANPKRITIEVFGNKTVAKVYDGDEVVKVGVAKCSPDDAFDFATGARIAFDRIYGEKTKPKTLRYVVAEREPSKVRDCWEGGVKGCPADYIYNNFSRYPDGCEDSCYECCDRPCPYKPESKQKTMHIVHRGYYYGEVGKPTELKDINGEALFVGDVVEKFDDKLNSYGTTYICNDRKNGDFVMGISINSGTKKNHGEITGGWKIIKRKSHEKARVGDSVDGLKIVTESEAYNE